MTYIAKSDLIEYETWFSKNINSRDLENYIDENTFSNNVHDKFNNLSSKKLVVGSHEKLIELN